MESIDTMKIYYCNCKINSFVRTVHILKFEHQKIPEKIYYTKLAKNYKIVILRRYIIYGIKKNIYIHIVYTEDINFSDDCLIFCLRVIYSFPKKRRRKKPFYKNLSRTGNKNARSVYLDKIVQVPRRVAVSFVFFLLKKHPPTWLVVNLYLPVCK